jgi:Trypsin-co-occurring domain 1
MPSFKEVTDAVEGIAESFVTTLRKVKPRKASVEFGLEVALEAGHLTALLVKGSGASNLKITLEWGESSSE